MELAPNPPKLNPVDVAAADDDDDDDDAGAGMTEPNENVDVELGAVAVTGMDPNENVEVEGAEDVAALLGGFVVDDDGDVPKLGIWKTDLASLVELGAPNAILVGTFPSVVFDDVAAADENV